MRIEVDQLLARLGGVATRTQLLTVLSRNQLDDEIRRGHLVALFPRTYCRPWDADVGATRERGALVSVGRPVALSHRTALRRWDLPSPAVDEIDVTVPAGRHPIGRAPGLRVHRTRVRTPIRRVGGLMTVHPATAIVRCWPMLTGSGQRAPAIEAVRRGIVQPRELREVCGAAVALRGRRQLLSLVGQLEAGCESELEVWGYLGVFDVPDLRHGVRQRSIRAGGRTYRLDLAYEDEQVAVELDGYRFHSAREQRERDMRRDSALASIGWLTLRFSHDRLHGDVCGCRSETLATLAVRRSRRRSG